MDLEDMGKRIRMKRISRSMSQEELAEKTNLSVPYIGMLERGERKPSIDSFVLIFDVLNATADELLCGNLKKGYLVRLAKYEEKIAKLTPEEAKRFYRVVDALLEM